MSKPLPVESFKVDSCYNGPFNRTSIELAMSKSQTVRWLEQFKGCKQIDDVPKEKK